MIDKRAEYERMFRAEQTLWWYRILHEKVSEQLQRQFPDQTDIAILDAGCGTGGLLLHLQQQGYTALEGFDFSADGVAFSQSRGLRISYHDIRHLADYVPGKRFDAIICNDVLMYISDEAAVSVLQTVRQRLKPNGLFISNNNAFDAFIGIHDYTVGGPKRFILSDIQRFAAAAGLHIRYATYWSLLLSPLILAVRSWQRFQIRRGWVDLSQATSDVDVPSPPINRLLYSLVKAESALLKKIPFGSSLFTVMQSDVT
ncbi:class I SAM-dependent methyltransferase [Fibrella sp. WM1]|uniref:class I SAM-dependent DNA methyltransferase n=1 Tax=Fibrella musci TaxID=3242485 RepID=UPI00352174AB